MALRTTGFNFDTLVSRAILEGTNSGVYVDRNEFLVPTTGDFTIGSMNFGPPSTHYLAESITITATGGKCRVQVNLITGPDNTSDSGVIRVYMNNNTVTIPLRRVLYSGTTADIKATFGVDGTTTTSSVSLFVSGYTVTADMHFDAKKTILWVGDSLIAGSAYGGLPLNAQNVLTANNPENHFPFLARNYFQDLGIDCRLVIKATGSKSSVDYERWRKYGLFEMPKVDLLLYQMETNDAPSTSDATYTANVNNFIAQRDRLWPNAKIILVGSLPSFNSATEARQAQLRTIKQNIAIANANNKVYYMNLGTSFPIESSYYIDGVGPAHITTATSVNNVYPAIKNWIDANNFTF